VTEARAWRDELEERAVKQGSITEKELEGAKPDWAGSFLQWRNKRETGDAMEEWDGSSLRAVGELLAVIFLKKREFPAKKKAK